MVAVKQERAARCYEFGPYVVDVAKSVLLRDGEIVPIGLKAFEVLLALIQHQGEVLKKDELLREVWPDTVVEENNLARTISALRKALDDHLDAPQYIATISGRGYRFVAGVKEIVKGGEGFSELVPERFNRHLASVESEAHIVPTVPAKRDGRLSSRHYKQALGAVLLLL